MRQRFQTVEIRQPSPLPFTRVSGRKRSAFYTQLARQLEAGISPVRALSTLGAQRGSRRLAGAARDMAAHIQSGGSLAMAMAEHPNVFPPNEVRMIEASERAGAVAETMLRIAKHLDRLAMFWRKVLTGLMYPALMLFVLLVVLPLLIAAFLGDPMVVLRAQAVSAAVLFVAVLAGITLWRSFAAVSGPRLFLHGLLLGVPILGSLARKLAVARFADVFECLYCAGVPTPEAISRAAMACGNAVLALRLLRVVPLIEDGEPTAAALARSHALPSTAIGMIAVGAESGKLDETLRKIAEYEHSDAEVILDRLPKVIEQVILFLYIGLMAFLILSVATGYISTVQKLLP